MRERKACSGFRALWITLQDRKSKDLLIHCDVQKAFILDTAFWEEGLAFTVGTYAIGLRNVFRNHRGFFRVLYKVNRYTKINSEEHQCC